VTRLNGVVSRFFYDTERSSAIFRMRGDGRTYSAKVPDSWRDYDDFVLTRPGDEVLVEMDVDDVLDTWYNETSATSGD
jgi:hypothetical protein